MVISGLTKYLGFMLGPEKRLESYTKPLAKYKERATQWGRQGLGLHLSLRAYSIYILPRFWALSRNWNHFPRSSSTTRNSLCADASSQDRTTGSSLMFSIYFGNLAPTLVCKMCVPPLWLPVLGSFGRLLGGVRDYVGGKPDLGKLSPPPLSPIACGSTRGWEETFSPTSWKQIDRLPSLLLTDALRTLSPDSSLDTKVPSSGMMANSISGNLWLQLSSTLLQW